jgi:hypothetical protein
MRASDGTSIYMGVWFLRHLRSRDHLLNDVSQQSDVDGSRQRFVRQQLLEDSLVCCICVRERLAIDWTRLRSLLRHSKSRFSAESKSVCCITH